MAESNTNERNNGASGFPASVDEVREQIGRIPDPEIPVVTLAELGILRDVSIRDDVVTVTLTPTYSGCPATEAIAQDVRTALQRLGHNNARVELTLSPPWTTDWITDAARKKLRTYGIAPPCHRAENGATGNSGQTSVIHFSRTGLGRDSDDTRKRQPACPRCDSTTTERLSEFGSTPCKALYRCLSCLEPFDYFKPF